MKFKLLIEETVTYKHEIIVEADSEKALDKACNEIEGRNSICESGSDYAFLLENKGFKNVEFIEDGSGDMPSVECTDLFEIDDSECDEDD